MKKSIIRFVPLILAAVFVIELTLQKTEDNVQLSEKFRIEIGNVLEEAGIDTTGMWWNDSGHFRKLAHVFEYFLFGVAIYIAFQNIWICVELSLSMSFLDQLIKIFVPIRHFDITDIPFDIVGWMSGIVVSFFAIKFLRGRGISKENGSGE